MTYIFIVDYYIAKTYQIAFCNIKFLQNINLKIHTVKNTVVSVRFPWRIRNNSINAVLTYMSGPYTAR